MVCSRQAIVKTKAPYITIAYSRTADYCAKLPADIDQSRSSAVSSPPAQSACPNELSNATASGGYAIAMAEYTGGETGNALQAESDAGC